MAYDDKAHRHDHQVKVRLDDEDFHELKDYAHELKAQHSVLAREIILAALAFKKEHGYRERLRLSTLLPAYSETVGNMTSRVFAEPLQVGDDVPAAIVEMTKDIDHAGNDLNSWAVGFFTEGLSHGLCHAFVDHPPAGELKTQADEHAAGVRPYVVLVKPDQVLGWRSKGGVLTMIRYIEVVEEEDGEFGAKCVEQIRVLEPGVWRTYRSGTKGGTWALHEEGTNSLTSIPWVTFYTGRTGFMTARPPLIELAHLNVKHWQSQSDQDNILHVIRVPILVRIGLQTQYDNQGRVVPPEFKVGTGQLTDLPANADLKYVEHTGQAVESGRTALQDLINEMRMAGANPTTNALIGMPTSQIQGLDAALALSITKDSALTTGAAVLPAGTQPQRPGAPSNGMLRYNTTTGEFEGYQGGAWVSIISTDPWALQPIGVPIPVFSHLTGVAEPPTSKAYRYVKLTAADAYNTGVFTSEAVSGSAPLVLATAVISLAGSPMNGQTVSLINTEQRVLRASLTSGELLNDAFQGHKFNYQAPPAGSFGGGSAGLGANNATQTTSLPITDGTNGTPRTANETRAKSIGATYYMRVK